MMRFRIKIVDVSILVLILCVIVMLYLMHTSNAIPQFVQIKTPYASYRYLLSTDQEFSVDGFLGKTDILIQGGSVDVLADPGPRKISVNHRPISQTGDWIASLPNGVLITIIGETSSKEKTEFDDVAY